MEKLADFLTGEKALRDKEQSIENAKKEAIKEEKNKRRRNIVEGKVELKEDPVQKKKVVQNIKLFEWSAPENPRSGGNQRQTPPRIHLLSDSARFRAPRP